MRKLVYFFVPGIPVSEGSTKAFRSASTGRIVVTHDSGRLNPWRRQVAIIARKALLGLSIDKHGEMALNLKFKLPCPKSKTTLLPPTVRPDLDKLIRAVCDSLTGIAYKDDSQVVSLHAQKTYVDKGNEGVGVVVSYQELAP